jgi:hypothetical protein
VAADGALSARSAYPVAIESSLKWINAGLPALLP